MFTKIYLTISIVLYCYNICSNFLWYFDGNFPVIICSQFIFKAKIMCICFCGDCFSFKRVVQFGRENVLWKHSYFSFTFKKIKYKSNLPTSSDFAVTSRRIIYSDIQTFPIIMSVFRTKLCMQHLRSSFWFLLTILSILSLTAFALI